MHNPFWQLHLLLFLQHAPALIRCAELLELHVMTASTRERINPAQCHAVAALNAFSLQPSDLIAASLKFITLRTVYVQHAPVCMPHCRTAIHAPYLLHAGASLLEHS
jgi:hypothetical protein